MPSKAVFSLRKHFPHSVSNMCACGLNKYQVHEPQGRAAEEDSWALHAVHRGQMNDKGLSRASQGGVTRRSGDPSGKTQSTQGVLFNCPGVRRCLLEEGRGQPHPRNDCLNSAQPESACFGPCWALCEKSGFLFSLAILMSDGFYFSRI